MFTARFLVQWIASERARSSVMPVAFWYFSLIGGVMLLAMRCTERTQFSCWVRRWAWSFIRAICGLSMLLAKSKSLQSRCGRTLLGAAGLMAVMTLVFRYWRAGTRAGSGFFYDPQQVSCSGEPGFLEQCDCCEQGGIVRIPRRGAGASAGQFSGWAGRVAGHRALLGNGDPALSCGPRRLVNGLLKRSFGRARPVQIRPFGGDGPFTQAWEVSDYCQSACSFVSAEVAEGNGAISGPDIGALWFAGAPAARIFRVGFH